MDALPLARLAVVSFALCVTTSAQNQIAWERAVPAPSVGQAVRSDASGNVVIAGSVGSPTDTLVVKYDAAGTALWSRTFDGLGGSDSLRDLAVDANGDIYAVGTSRHPSTLLDEATVLRYDASGSLLWSRVFAPAGFEAEAGGVVLDGAGGVLVTGTTTGPGGGVALWKYDTAGNLLFTNVASQPNVFPRLPTFGCVRAASGDIVAASLAGTLTGESIAIARFTPSGSVAWARSLVPPGYGYAFASRLAIDAAGATYIAGRCATAADPAPHDGLLAKYDAAGTLAWTQLLVGGPGLDDGYGDVAIDPLGGVVVVGAFSSGTQTLAVAEKYDAAGSPLWFNTHVVGPVSIWWLSRVAIDGSGDIVAAGSANDGGIDATLMRFDNQYGDLKWVQRLDAGANESGVDVQLTASGSILYLASSDGRAVTRRLDPLVSAFCLGDGSGTACPCGNASTPFDRAGCMNSLGVPARLTEFGVSRLSSDSLRLFTTGLTDSSAVFFQGTSTLGGSLGSVFGDGLRCAGGSVRRLGTRPIIGGFSIFPDTGNPVLSVLGLVTTPGERFYQVWYRNAAGFCTASTFNLSNGLRVTWAP